MGVFRRMFGPSKDEIWRQLSAEIDGRFVDGTWTSGARVQARHGEWQVTLDTFAVSTGKVTVIYTRMRAPYVNPSGFRFTVYRKSLFSGIARKLGMQDVEVGHQAFDEDFVIKGTDEHRLRELFANDRIRELIAAQPGIHFSVKDDEGWFGADFPEGVDELEFHVPGVIKDVERLGLLFDLFAATLDELCRTGSADERAPDVRL
jgi:hypothetical protein